MGFYLPPYLSLCILHWILLCCCYVLNEGRTWLTQNRLAGHVFCQHPTPDQTHFSSADCRLSGWSQSIIPFNPYTIYDWVKDWEQVSCTTLLLVRVDAHLLWRKGPLTCNWVTITGPLPQLSKHEAAVPAQSQESIGRNGWSNQSLLPVSESALYESWYKLIQIIVKCLCTCCWFCLCSLFFVDLYCSLSWPCQPFFPDLCSMKQHVKNGIRWYSAKFDFSANSSSILASKPCKAQCNHWRTNVGSQTTCRKSCWSMFA